MSLEMALKIHLWDEYLTMKGAHDDYFMAIRRPFYLTIYELGQKVPQEEIKR